MTAWKTLSKISIRTWLFALVLNIPLFFYFVLNFHDVYNQKQSLIVSCEKLCEVGLSFSEKCFKYIKTETLFTKTEMTNE